LLIGHHDTTISGTSHPAKIFAGNSWQLITLSYDAYAVVNVGLFNDFKFALLRMRHSYDLSLSSM
jgi:hypothetical protein